MSGWRALALRLRRNCCISRARTVWFGWFEFARVRERQGCHWTLLP
jgi:hypothetical protein